MLRQEERKRKLLQGLLVNGRSRRFFGHRAVIRIRAKPLSDAPNAGIDRHRFLSGSLKATMPFRPENIGANGDYDKETPEADKNFGRFAMRLSERSAIPVQKIRLRQHFRKLPYRGGQTE